MWWFQKDSSIIESRPYFQSQLTSNLYYSFNLRSLIQWTIWNYSLPFAFCSQCEGSHIHSDLRNKNSACKLRMQFILIQIILLYYKRTVAWFMERIQFQYGQKANERVGRSNEVMVAYSNNNNNGASTLYISTMKVLWILPWTWCADIIVACFTAFWYHQSRDYHELNSFR